MPEQRSDRQLAAHVIADTTAGPIPLSVAQVIPRTAERVGYVLVGICQHCTDAVISRDRAAPTWVHREHGTPACLRSRSRYGEAAEGAALSGETPRR